MSELIPQSSTLIEYLNSSKLSPLKNVYIDTTKFIDGFDPLVEKINYYPSTKKWTPVEESQGLAKRNFTSQATQIFNAWINTKSGQKGRSGKQIPFFRNALQKFRTVRHPFGECLIGAANKTKSGFKVRFMNKKGSDAYVHHVAIFANSVCKKPIHSTEAISAISAKKSESDALTISHLCGNGGCARPGHFIIEKKKINDERSHCHFLLRRTKSLKQGRIIRNICPHKPKCFVNKYKIKSVAYF